MEQGIYGSRDPFCPLTLNWQRFVTSGRPELRVVNKVIDGESLLTAPADDLGDDRLCHKARIPRRRHRHPCEDLRRHVISWSYSCGKLTTRRHSHDYPRKDVGKDVGVSVGVGVVECQLKSPVLRTVWRVNYAWGSIALSIGDSWYTRIVLLLV